MLLRLNPHQLRVGATQDPRVEGFLCAASGGGQAGADARTGKHSSINIHDPRFKGASPEYVQGLAEFVSGNMLFVLLHEMAHVSITQMGLPVLGRMEDAADTYPALRLRSCPSVPAACASHPRASAAASATDCRKDKSGRPRDNWRPANRHPAFAPNPDQVSLILFLSLCSSFQFHFVHAPFRSHRR
jgi:hypothetical protein